MNGNQNGSIVFPLLAVLLLTSVVTFGQGEKPVFRATTQLVEFTFVALDKKGKAVTDLLPEEVQIFENGRWKDPAFFRFEGSVPPTRQTEPLPAGTFSNRVEYIPGPARNVSALVLDTLNTRPTDMLNVRAEVTRYLRKLAPQTRVALYLLGPQLMVLHDFGDDLESLRHRIQKLSLPTPVRTESDISALARDAEIMIAMTDNPLLEKMLRDHIEMEGMYNAEVRKRRVDDTLAALETLGQHLAGIPGRKNLIWISGGISTLSVTGAMGSGPHGGFVSHEEKIRATAQSLAQKDIVLYVVDARPLNDTRDPSEPTRSPMPVRGRGRFAPQLEAEATSADPLPAAYRMADITGGRVVTNTNQASEGMEIASQDLLGAYSAAFYSENEPDGKWHKWKVKSLRSGVHIRCRQGYLASPPVAVAAEWSADQWRSAIHNPITSTALSLDAQWETVTEKEMGTVALLVRLDPSQLSFRTDKGKSVVEYEIGIAERGPSGTLSFHQGAGSIPCKAAEPSANAPGSCLFRTVFKPLPGTVSIRIVVRDRNTGRFGTLDISPGPIPGE